MPNADDCEENVINRDEFDIPEEDIRGKFAEFKRRFENANASKQKYDDENTRGAPSPMVGEDPSTQKTTDEELNRNIAADVIKVLTLNIPFFSVTHTKCTAVHVQHVLVHKSPIIHRF